MISGNAVLRLDDDELALERLDAVRIACGTERAVEGGPDGAELLAFGAPNTENKDAEMLPGWWGDSSAPHPPRRAARRRRARVVPARRRRASSCSGRRPARAMAVVGFAAHFAVAAGVEDDWRPRAAPVR